MLTNSFSHFSYHSHSSFRLQNAPTPVAYTPESAKLRASFTTFSFTQISSILQSIFRNKIVKSPYLIISISINSFGNLTRKASVSPSAMEGLSLNERPANGRPNKTQLRIKYRWWRIWNKKRYFSYENCNETQTKWLEKNVYQMWSRRTSTTMNIAEKHIFYFLSFSHIFRFVFYFICLLHTRSICCRVRSSDPTDTNACEDSEIDANKLCKDVYV